MWTIAIDELPPSLNEIYAGVHFRKRKMYADKWHLLFLAAFRKAKLPKPLPTPITLNLTSFCKGVVRDTDNGILGIKFLGDSLKKYGYIKDDSPLYIPIVILQSKKGKTNKLAITIQ